MRVYLSFIRSLAWIFLLSCLAWGVCGLLLKDYRFVLFSFRWNRNYSPSHWWEVCWFLVSNLNSWISHHYLLTTTFQWRFRSHYPPRKVSSKVKNLGYNFSTEISLENHENTLVSNYLSIHLFSIHPNILFILLMSLHCWSISRRFIEVVAQNLFRLNRIKFIRLVIRDWWIIMGFRLSFIVDFGLLGDRWWITVSSRLLWVSVSFWGAYLGDGVWVWWVREGFMAIKCFLIDHHW